MRLLIWTNTHVQQTIDEIGFTPYHWKVRVSATFPRFVHLY